MTTAAAPRAPLSSLDAFWFQMEGKPAHGVWVCPILVNEPSARLGERLADALAPFPLAHPACWTCHVFGVSCRT